MLITSAETWKVLGRAPEIGAKVLWRLDGISAAKAGGEEIESKILTNFCPTVLLFALTSVGKTKKTCQKSFTTDTS
jgi:hypothetical protein